MATSPGKPLSCLRPLDKPNPPPFEPFPPRRPMHGQSRSTSALTTSIDIARPHHRLDEDSNLSSSRRDPSATILSSSPPQSHRYDQGLSFVSSQGTSPIEEVFSRRKLSISFDPQVTLESGTRLSLEGPLPRAVPSRPVGRFIIGDPLDSAHTSDDEYAGTPPSKYPFEYTTGRPLAHRTNGSYKRYTEGEMRHPLLQSTVDDLARESVLNEDTDEPLASLTSGTTASSLPIGEAPTPPPERDGEDILGQGQMSSPIEFPTSNSLPFGRRTNSQRSRSYRSMASSVGSFRRSSRRSTRSGTSISPAGAFLSQWGGRDEAASAAEPDDEGQEIGDHSEYIIGRQIGYGGFSVVKEVYTIENGQKVKRAVKIVRKLLSAVNETDNDKLQTQFEHEVSIWRFLNHRYVLPLIAVYDSPFATFCITKLNIGGTLFDLVRKNRKVGNGGVSGDIGKRYVYQLCSAIRYLHEDHHLVHRDIKLENCLLDMSGPRAEIEGGNVLLCDFGMADYITNEHRASPEPESYLDREDSSRSRFGPSQTSTAFAGSLMYAAPELFTASSSIYSTAADMWSFGVVVYALLTSQMPFSHAFEPKLAQLIQEGNYDEAALHNALADSGRTDQPIDLRPIDLVRGCLELDPSLRWTVRDALDCEWLEGCKELYEEPEALWA